MSRTATNWNKCCTLFSSEKLWQQKNETPRIIFWIGCNKTDSKVGAPKPSPWKTRVDRTFHRECIWFLIDSPGGFIFCNFWIFSSRFSSSAVFCCLLSVAFASITFSEVRRPEKSNLDFCCNHSPVSMSKGRSSVQLFLVFAVFHLSHKLDMVVPTNIDPVISLRCISSCPAVQWVSRALIYSQQHWKFLFPALSLSSYFHFSSFFEFVIWQIRSCQLCPFLWCFGHLLWGMKMLLSSISLLYSFFLLPSMFLSLFDRGLSDSFPFPKSSFSFNKAATAGWTRRSSFWASKFFD